VPVEYAPSHVGVPIEYRHTHARTRPRWLTAIRALPLLDTGALSDWPLQALSGAPGATLE